MMPIMSDSLDTISILGPGRVGQVIASSIALAGFPTRLTGIDAPWSGRVVTRWNDGPPRCVDFAARGSMSESLARAPVILVTERANDLAFALSRVVSHARRSSAVIICCNGDVDHEIADAERLRRDIHWRRGVVTFGVRRDDDGALRRAGHTGRLTFGPWRPPRPEDSIPTSLEKSLIDRLPVDTRWDADVYLLARHKWLLNTTLNTLCALKRLSRNADALGYPDELRRLFDEAFDLGVNRWGPWHPTRESLWEELSNVIRDTAENENSMARDVREGRPTESPWLAGRATTPQQWPALVEAHRSLTRDT